MEQEKTLPHIARDYANIVEEFTQYIIDFVEQPRPELGNLPVCPFARKARLERRVGFKVLNLTYENILALAPTFLKETEESVLICIHPRKNGLSYKDVHKLVDALNRELRNANVEALGGHPEDPFNIEGLYTRREPYPNIQMIRLDVGEESYLKLKDSGYYDLWTEQHFRQVVLNVECAKKVAADNDVSKQNRI